MPDQVRVPDPPTVSAPLPIKMSQDLLLHHYHDYAHAPRGISPSGSLLLSRSASPLKPPAIRHGSQDWRHPATGGSPHGGSSGYSDGSCGSSPARSPKLDTTDAATAPDDVMVTGHGERPLSLVIRKNRDHLADPNSNVPEYTVHQRGPYHPQFPPYAPTSSLSSRADIEEEAYCDSGTEEDLEPPLVISEPQEEEEELEQEQVTARDLSLKKSTSHHNKEHGLEAEDDDEADCKEIISKGSTIKIRDFARVSSAPEDNQATALETAATSGAGIDDNMSDLSSECHESVSSVDTWQSTFMEGRPFVPEACRNMVMRRVSTASGAVGQCSEPGTGVGSGVAYQCDFCERIFGSKSHLQSHLVTHTGERAFNCRMCQKTFGRKSTLRAHMTTHTKTSNFMCTVCEKACNDNNSLEEHMRMHTGEKPFTCKICQKAYARKSHLNVHYRVHTGERPFVCHHCDKDFTEKRFLNDHLQTAHNGAEGPLRCPNCCREFAYKTSLKQHLKKLMCERNINRGHGGTGTGGAAVASGVMKQFQCPFCDKSYSWKQTLKQHVSMYHRNKIHTDEFWRHELTKNRRSMVDDKVNEDLWRKQIGKHSEENSSLGGSHLIKSDPCNDEQQEHQLPSWLEPAVTEETASGQMTTEMKLRALQSLQNSLSLMTRGLATNAVSDANNNTSAMTSLQQLATLNNNNSCNNNFNINQPASGSRQYVKREMGSGLQQPDSYLALLAQLARESESQIAGRSTRNSYSSEAEEHQQHHPIPMLPTKEESAVKRTQMWLQQVNRYRSSRPPREEADMVNHDQLWEQQIARVKRNPVKSPLEPVEIVLDEGGVEAEQQHIRQVQSMCSFNINNNNNNMTAANNNNLQNNYFIANNNNNNNDGSLIVFEGKFLPPQRPSFCSSPLAALAPSSCDGSSTGNDKDHSLRLSPMPHRPSQDSSTADRSQTPGSLKTSGSTNITEGGRGEDHFGGDRSMLKSLLLDRMKRKLSTVADDKGQCGQKKAFCLPGPPPPSSPARTTPLPHAPQDILRKRLLGWVDPPAAAPLTVELQQHNSSRSQQSATAVQSPAADQPAEHQATSKETTHSSELQHQEQQSAQQQQEQQSNLQQFAQQQSAQQRLAQQQQEQQSSKQNLPEQEQQEQEQSERHTTPFHQLEDKEELVMETGSKISVSYAHTSVLKHLLYRYTSMGQ